MGQVTEEHLSFDYFATYDLPRVSTLWRWVSVILSGSQAGLVFGVIKILSDYFNELRFEVMAAFGGGWGSLGSLAAISIPLITLSCSLIVWLEPVAGGSGITDVYATLNGLIIPRLYRPLTYLLRAFGLWVALSSGLWVGAEGPMIYIGAAAAHMVSRLISRLTMKRGLTAKENYDMLCCGAAMGSAAAFRAPLTGVVMLMEGFGILWHHGLVWQTLCGSYVAVIVSSTFVSKFKCTFQLCSAEPGDFEYSSEFAVIGGSGALAVLCASITLGVFSASFSWLHFHISEVVKLVPASRKAAFGIAFLFIVSLVTFVVFTAIAVAVPPGFAGRELARLVTHFPPLGSHLTSHRGTHSAGVFAVHTPSWRDVFGKYIFGCMRRSVLRRPA
jgi:H+/Cl- antiporter ClcA